MKVIARQLHWPEAEVVKHAKRVHKLELRKKEEATTLVSSRMPRAIHKKRRHKRWRETVKPQIVEFIEKQNQLDVDIYHYAIQSFKQRFSTDCQV